MASRLLLAATFILWAAPAAAQGVGLQGGATVDPEQIYVGSHWEAVVVSDRFVIRPNIEGGFGGGLALAQVNLEFLYRFPLEGTAWSLYQGTGPSVNIFRIDEATDVRGGLGFAFGFAHTTGFFTEIKVGTAGSPSLKFGVGFTVR